MILQPAAETLALLLGVRRPGREPGIRFGKQESAGTFPRVSPRRGSAHAKKS